MRPPFELLLVCIITDIVENKSINSSRLLRATGSQNLHFSTSSTFLGLTVQGHQTQLFVVHRNHFVLFNFWLILGRCSGES